MELHSLTHSRKQDKDEFVFEEILIIILFFQPNFLIQNLCPINKVHFEETVSQIFIFRSYVLFHAKNLILYYIKINKNKDLI